MKYKTTFVAATFGTYEEFKERYNLDEFLGITTKENDEKLLWSVVGNGSFSIEKYRIIKFLIEKGTNVDRVNKDGASLFLSIFLRMEVEGTQIKNINEVTSLCKTLLEKGADITALYKPDKTVMFKSLFTYTDRGVLEENLLPLYNLIFSQKGLKLLTKDKFGLSVLEFAKKGENNKIGVKMMEDYIKKYNLQEG